MKPYQLFKAKEWIFSLFVMILMLMVPAVVQGSYTPPIGIPAPGFGIDETHTMYAGQTYATGGFVYKDAGNGPYTHYVDNTATCTDTSNEYGTQSSPRCTFPDGGNLAEGSVVEIHGGLYLTPSQYRITSSGSQAKPIFIRGASFENKPVFERLLRIRGAYIIVENIDFNKNNRAESAVSIRPDPVNDPSGSVHHISIRNNEAQNYYDSGDTANSSMMGASSDIDGDVVHDIVYYNNYIHLENHDIYPTPDAFETDVNGIAVAQRTENIWILDNEISRCAGDAIGSGHGADHTARNYYIGRNDLHTTGENAIDLKEVENIVISQNTMHNFSGESAGSNGTALVVHYGPTLSAINVWILFNEIYDSTDNAIQVGGDQQYPVYIVGNVIRDIFNPAGTAQAFISWGSQDLFFIGNSVYNVDNGIDSDGPDSATFYMENNIVSTLSNLDGNHLRLDSTTYRNNSVLKNNVFYQPSSDVRIYWGGNTYNVNEFQLNTGKCSGCIELDPLFANPLLNNFFPEQGSPAIDNGTESVVYQTFQDLYGLNIRVDFKGSPRPQGTAWDIGAYEFTRFPWPMFMPAITVNGKQ